MTAPVVLPPKLDLPAAAPLTEQLRGCLDGDLTLDAGEVTHIGALCLQVLLAAATSLRKAGHSLSLVHCSDRLVEQLAQMGFTPESITEGRA